MAHMLRRWRGRTLRGCVAMSAALGMACLPGCAFRSAPAENRAYSAIAAPLAADQWPARETALLEDMARLTPKSLTLAYPVTIISNGRLHSETRATPVNVVSCDVYGRGIVRFFQPLDDDPAMKPEDRELREHLFGGLQFVSFPPDSNAARIASSARDGENSSRYRRFLFRRLGIRSGRDQTYFLMRQGTPMRIFEPVAGGEPRGVVLHLSSLAGFDYEKPVIDLLCNHGWLVLQIDASTTRRRENPVRADASGDLRHAAEQLARSIDNRVAEIAYAAEAGLDYLQDTRPRLMDKPVAVAGYSAGALVAPTVATLLHNRIDALVVVGGGANLLNIARRSSLTNGGIAVRWEGAAAGDSDPNAAPEADWARLEDAYLAASKLDPYKTAPYVLDKPVLMLHGVFDDIVPADMGDLLYRRLGRPERFVFTLGHRGLFWRLPSQAGLITRWLEKAVPEGQSGPGAYSRVDQPGGAGAGTRN